MSKWKSWIGIVLIVASVAGLIFWELQGREVFLMKPVLVASEEISAGTVVSAGAFTTVQVPEANLVEGALSAKAAASLNGSCAKETILKNQQIAYSYFMEEEERLEKGESIFAIPKEWIIMRSSALRKGDRVLIYTGGTLQMIGTYRIAFVKDQGEQEVTEPEGGWKADALERTNSTAEINHVEIVTTLEEYGKIREMAVAQGGLLLVQEDVWGVSKGE